MVEDVRSMCKSLGLIPSLQKQIGREERRMGEKEREKEEGRKGEGWREVKIPYKF